MTQNTQVDPRSGCLKFFLIVLAVAILITAWGYLTDGELSDYCADYMYDQGFRGDDLTTMLQACIDNPPPGAP